MDADQWAFMQILGHKDVTDGQFRLGQINLYVVALKLCDVIQDSNVEGSLFIQHLRDVFVQAYQLESDVEAVPLLEDCIFGRSDHNVDIMAESEQRVGELLAVLPQRPGGRRSEELVIELVVGQEVHGLGEVQHLSFNELQECLGRVVFCDLVQYLGFD